MSDQQTSQNNTQNIAEAIQEVSERAQLLVREEIELAKAEVTAKVTKLIKGAVIAAVPIDPDGTFTIVSGVNERLSVRWWAVAGNAALAPSAPQQLTQAAPKRAPRRARSARARQE